MAGYSLDLHNSEQTTLGSLGSFEACIMPVVTVFIKSLVMKLKHFACLMEQIYKQGKIIHNKL